MENAVVEIIKNDRDKTWLIETNVEDREAVLNYCFDNLCKCKQKYPTETYQLEKIHNGWLFTVYSNYTKI